LVGKIVPGEKGRLIAKAFEMKVEGLTNTEVAAKLYQLGLRLDKNRLSEFFKNPFYCGYIAHSLMEGEVIKGKHYQMIYEQIKNGRSEIYLICPGRPGRDCKCFVRDSFTV
jgi:site-specific DNA recombinase